jgi:photosystem II stability/assembly factor-like uncharacterized protein
MGGVLLLALVLLRHAAVAAAAEGTTRAFGAYTAANGQIRRVGDTEGVHRDRPSTAEISPGQHSGVESTLNAVGFGAGQWVVVGDSGVLLTSSDTVSWTPQSVPTNVSLHGRDLRERTVDRCVGYTGTILNSTDARSWHLGAVRDGGGAPRHRVRGRKRYVVVGDSGTILNSADAETWQRSRRWQDRS